MCPHVTGAVPCSQVQQACVLLSQDSHGLVCSRCPQDRVDRCCRLLQACRLWQHCRSPVVFVRPVQGHGGAGPV